MSESRSCNERTILFWRRIKKSQQVRILDFTGKAIGTQHQLQWLVDADEQITGAAVEYSMNGSSFFTLSGFTAASGSYSYTPPAAPVIFYRCKVTLDNGETHYSKTISIYRAKNNDGPDILVNPVTNGTITVTNGNKHTYVLLDIMGRPIKSGILNEGNTTVRFQPSGKGVYIVKFIDKTGEMTTKKVVVQ